MVEQNINTMSPKQLLAAFSMFEDDDIKDRIMSATLKAFKGLQLDIRKFDISQLSQIIKLVMKHSP
jgi:hypothetical protein